MPPDEKLIFGDGSLGSGFRRSDRDYLLDKKIRIAVVKVLLDAIEVVLVSLHDDRVFQKKLSFQL